MVLGFLEVYWCHWFASLVKGNRHLGASSLLVLRQEFIEDGFRKRPRGKNKDRLTFTVPVSPCFPYGLHLFSANYRPVRLDLFTNFRVECQERPSTCTLSAATSIQHLKLRPSAFFRITVHTPVPRQLLYLALFRIALKKWPRRFPAVAQRCDLLSI